jgi:hypothetical protein
MEILWPRGDFVEKDEYEHQEMMCRTAVQLLPTAAESRVANKLS